MTKILPDENAEVLCRKMMADFDRSPEMSRLKAGRTNGKQFGVLISDKKTYYAFSGSLDGSYIHNGYVPPAFDTEEFDRINGKYEQKIKNEADKAKRHIISKACWEEIKRIYTFHCFDGQIRCLSDIFPSAPSGTGDCCTIKLLNACYKDGGRPLEMSEFFYGSGKTGHCSFCTPCKERCRPLLPYIIGLDIIYYDGEIAVVNKPSGLLSIQGRGEDKQDSIAKRITDFYNAIRQPCVHRLDQDTSGLMVLGLTQAAHDRLSRDFENRLVHKEYEAVVEGEIKEREGCIRLFQRLDTEHRPLQIIDDENGKEAVTYFKKMFYSKKTDTTTLLLTPVTGRTHQLRLACRHIGHPILGDRLYGNPSKAERLMLSAVKLEFAHPAGREKMSFTL